MMNTRSPHRSGAARFAAPLLALVLLLSACALTAPAPTPAQPTPSNGMSAAPAPTPAQPTPSNGTSAAPVGDSAEPSDAVFTDPQGQFSVPIPTGWIAEQRDDMLLLSDLAGQISAYALVVANADPQAAVAEAWRQIDPAWARAPTSVQEPPPTGGVERVVTINYEAGDGQRALIGYGRLYQGATYVLLVDADAAALQRRAAQIAIIVTGYAITALPVVDLRGVAPAQVDAAMTSEPAPPSPSWR